MASKEQPVSVERDTKVVHSLDYALYAAYACAGMYISAVCGWASLSSVLEQDGIFAESCADDGWQRPCLAQLDNLVQVYTVSIVMLALSSPLAGCIVDHSAPWVPVVFAGACVCIGSMGIALLPSTAGPQFIPAFAILSVGGNATYFAASRLAFFLPLERRPFTLSLISTLYDASSAVPVLFFFAYTSLHVSRALIFASYSVLGMLLFGTWALFIGRARLINAARIEEKQQSVDSSVRVDVPPIHTQPLPQQLSSLQFWMGLVWFVVHQQYCNLYLGTVRYVLLRQGDDDGRYMALFTSMLPCSILCVPAISACLTRFGILATMQVVSALGTVLGLMTALLPLRCQPLNFFIFTAFRAAAFSAFSNFGARAFGPDATGSLLGIIFFVGGCASLHLAWVSHYVNEQLDGDWTFVYYAYTFIFLPKFAVVGAAGRYWQHAARQAPGVARMRTFGAAAFSAVEASDTVTEYHAI